MAAMTRGMVLPVLAASMAALLTAPVRPAAAAEKWDLYVYNAVSTVAAVQGLTEACVKIAPQLASK